MSCLLDYSHSDRCEVYFIVVFTWISLVMTDVEACCGWAHHCWWAGRWGWPPPGYVTWWCMPVVDPLVAVVIMCMCSVVSDFATSWTVSHKAPLSMVFPRQEYWSGFPFPPSPSILQGSSWPRDWTLISCISCIGSWILYPCTTWEAWMLVVPGVNRLGRGFQNGTRHCWCQLSRRRFQK